jgi:GT2 family glycosyltransferase
MPPSPAFDFDVSVVIVNWNVGEFVRTCLKSVLAESDDLRLQIIVVDNASADGSPEIVEDEFPQVELIRNPDNRGFAAGCNQGLAVSKGEFVLMLNPDTEILDGALGKSLALMREHRDWGVLGCQVLKSRGGEIQRTGFSFPGPMNLFLIATLLHRVFPRSKFFGRPELSFWDRQSERRVDVVTGMYMFIRREAIDAVGPMDEAYFVYGEEADWCYRFGKAGWPCVFSPLVQVVHADGGKQSTSQIPVRMFVQLQKSLLIFNRKNLGFWAWLAAKMIFVGSMTFRSLGFLASSLWKGRPAWLRARCTLAALRYQLTGWEPARG